MVRSKREMITPRKRASLLKKQKILERTITKTLLRPNSANTNKKESTANIKVIVRVRPPNSKEQCDNYRNVVQVVEDDMLIFDPEEQVQGFFFHGVQQKGRDFLKKVKKNMKFNFDKIYQPESTNSEVFKGTTHSLINNIMDGYNCSVFAYGATGAGKTFTMTGTSDNPGITFLTMTELFKKQEELANERDFEIGITYLEVYNELVKDLLNPGPPLNLREDTNYGVIVAGIKVFKISNSHELFALLEQGNKNRTQHPTDANAESSRSHAVFQVYLKMTFQRTNEIRTSKLSMIDLAGSERGSATGFTGARFTEGANINKSLLALGNCINSLADGHRHVPYRDSKLTRLLKDSLGGNCQTVMIANVSPSSMSFDDTYNTLKYATRANSIRANVHRNVTKTDMNVMQYIKLVEDLKEENQSLKKENQSLKKETQSLEKENQSAKKELELEKTKSNSLETEYLRLKLELEHSAKPEHVDESVCIKINTLVQQKRDLLNKRFQLERNESSTALRRLLKEDIDNGLSIDCTDTSEKDQDNINRTITIFKEQESVFRDDIEETEDIADGIDKKLDEYEMKYPQCRQMIETHRLKLLLLRTQHRSLLQQRCSELMVEEHEEQSKLLENMSTKLQSCFKILVAHGFVTPSLAKQYKDIFQVIQERRNIKCSELQDSGVSSMSSIQDDEGSQTSSITRNRKIAKSPRNKENIYRKPFESTKSVIASKSVVTRYGVKDILKPRVAPLANRPKFRS